LKFFDAGKKGLQADGAFQEGVLGMEVEMDEFRPVHTGLPQA